MMSAAADRLKTGHLLARFAGHIVTDRLLLRPVEADDTEALYARFNDWEVVRWLAAPAWPQSRELMSRTIDRYVSERQAGTLLVFVIEFDCAAIGSIGLTLHDGLLHLGYWLGRDHWGRGLMSEAAAGVVDMVFRLTGESAIISGAFDGNQASMRIQRKLGFVETGTSVHFSTPRGQDLVHLDTKLTCTARRVVLERTKQ